MKAIVAAVSLVIVVAASNGPLEARTRGLRGKGAGTSAAVHPLEPLSADEHRAAYDVVRAHFAANGLAPEALLFLFIALQEPAKSFVRSWNGTLDFRREATLHVLHAPSNRLWTVTVDLRGGSVTRLELMPAGTQPAVAAEEYGPACRSQSGAAVAADDVRRTESRRATAVTPSRWR